MLLKIEVKENLLIGGYTGTSSYNKQSAMWRLKNNIKEHYYIPGASLKGAIRERAEQISNSLGGEYIKACKSLFGTADNEGKIAVGSAFAKTEEDTDKSLNSVPITRSKISRASRTTSKNALFTEMPSGRDFTLVSKVTIYDDLTDIERKLFNSAISLTDGVGSNKGIGKGSIKITVLDEEIDDKTTVKLSETGDYFLVAEPIETLRITQKKTKSYFYDSYNYIPGTTLRGAFAKIFDEDSLNLIIKSGRVNFPNLYPSEEKRPIFPAPLTLRTIKGENTIYTDLIIPYLVKEFLKDKGFTFAIREKSESNKRLNNFGGYCYQDDMYLKKANYSIETFFTTHTSLDRKTKTTKKGLLWTYMNIYSPLFVGRFHCDDPEIINRMGNVKYLRIGGAKNRGYGLVSVKIIPIKRQDHFELMKKFNDRLNSMIKKYIQDSPIDESEMVIPVLLASDTLLPFEKQIEDIFKDMKADVLIKFVRHDFTYGFNVLYKKLKDRFRVISMGSIILIKTSKGNTGSIINSLYNQGIGLKRAEGYGRVEIISPLIKKS